MLDFRHLAPRRVGALPRSSRGGGGLLPRYASAEHHAHSVRSGSTMGSACWQSEAPIRRLCIGCHGKRPMALLGAATLTLVVQFSATMYATC